MRGPWLLCRSRRPAAGVRLYCFPHSGGSPGEYMQWSELMPAVEVWAVQLPARGSRLHEQPVWSMSELVEAFLEDVELEPPFAFFGHSLGALVAFETARALRAAGRELPSALLLSACEPPHATVPDPHMRTLSDEQLIAWVTERYGALPAELLAEPALLELLLPATRSDLTIYHEYAHVPGPALDMPTLVMGGDRDRITPELLGEWRRYCDGEFDTQLFPGGHFYLREHRDWVVGVINARVTDIQTAPVNRTP